VASNPEPRNWKGIIISVLVILSVILMVALAVVWMTPPDPGPRHNDSGDKSSRFK
jgi:amino acid transporter